MSDGIVKPCESIRCGGPDEVATFTVGDLREVLASTTLPDSALVRIEPDGAPSDVYLAFGAYEQSTDAIDGPGSTDPMEESTVGILIIDAADR